MASFHDTLSKGLRWYPEHGVGYYPVVGFPYDASYFAKYGGYAATDMGRALTEARVALVRSFFSGTIVDIGIGSGAFVAATGAKGFDVNPAGRDWLKARGAFVDPYTVFPEAVSCWDSLEHMEAPWRLLARVRRFVFVSLPIFEGPEHVLRSKHFRRDEHYWYFTEMGFERFATDHGFKVAARNGMESDLGREDIGTFVLERMAA